MHGLFSITLTTSHIGNTAHLSAIVSTVVLYCYSVNFGNHFSQKGHFIFGAIFNNS